MSEMIERVARALAALDFESPDAEFYARHIDSVWRNYEDEARTAIEAMREPTEVMKVRGRIMAEASVISEATNEYSAEVSDNAAADIWQEMVDAALSR